MRQRSSARSDAMHDLTVLQTTRAFADRIDQSPCNGCDECGARCTAGVPMLEAEFTQIRGYVESPDGAEARQSAKDVDRLRGAMTEVRTKIERIERKRAELLATLDD